MLGTLLMLRHAPGVARTGVFATKVREWRVAVARPRSAGPAPAPAGPGAARKAGASAGTLGARPSPLHRRLRPRAGRGGAATPRPECCPARRRRDAAHSDRTAAGRASVHRTGVGCDQRPGRYPPSRDHLLRSPPGWSRFHVHSTAAGNAPPAPEPARPAASIPAPTEDARESPADSPPPVAEPAPTLAGDAPKRRAVAQPAPRRATDGQERGATHRSARRRHRHEARRPLLPGQPRSLPRSVLRLHAPARAWARAEPVGARRAARRVAARRAAGGSCLGPARRAGRPRARRAARPRVHAPAAMAGTAGVARAVRARGAVAVVGRRRSAAHRPSRGLHGRRGAARCPRSRSAAARRAAALVPVRSRTWCARLCRASPHQDLARWVARLGGYARARLAAALSVADPATVGEVVLAHPAEVLVTPTHVDVRLSLAELPLEIRLAGLDRDPGWIPAAGRFLAFHFS